MIENARLAAAYEDLEKAIVNYGEAQRAYAKDLRRGIHSGLSSTDFDKATRRYETREKAFNREVSDAIKETGEVPPGAVNMLNYQRHNGFHAKGLAKIITMHTKTGEEMAEKEAEKPWPLVVTSVVEDAEKHARDGADLLRIHLDQLYQRGRKMLEAEGRMGDIRRLTLVCHSEDKNIVQIVKDQPKEKECEG